MAASATKQQQHILGNKTKKKSKNEKRSQFATKWQQERKRQQQFQRCVKCLVVIVARALTRDAISLQLRREEEEQNEEHFPDNE